MRIALLRICILDSAWNRPAKVRCEHIPKIMVVESLTDDLSKRRFRRQIKKIFAHIAGHNPSFPIIVMAKESVRKRMIIDEDRLINLQRFFFGCQKMRDSSKSTGFSPRRNTMIQKDTNTLL